MTDQPWLDVISHFDLPKKFGHRLRDRDLRDLVQPVLDRVMETRLAIEINTAGWRKEVAEAYPSPLILELMHERGIPICFGADAHEPEHVGYRFDDAVRLAREAGYAESVSHRQRQLERIPLPVGIDRNEDRLNL
jgi:histidinol-phosphatase (PHP family)